MKVLLDGTSIAIQRNFCPANFSEKFSHIFLVNFIFIIILLLLSYHNEKEKFYGDAKKLLDKL